LNLFSPPFPSWKAHTRLLHSRASSMEGFDLFCFKHHWAKSIQPYISWELCVYLFRACIIKQQLILNFLQKLGKNSNSTFDEITWCIL
jgi:hypothetical protein